MKTYRICPNSHEFAQKVWHLGEWMPGVRCGDCGEKYIVVAEVKDD